MREENTKRPIYFPNLVREFNFDPKEYLFYLFSSIWFRGLYQVYPYTLFIIDVIDIVIVYFYMFEIKYLRVFQIHVLLNYLISAILLFKLRRGNQAVVCFVILLSQWIINVILSKYFNKVNLWQWFWKGGEMPFLGLLSKTGFFTLNLVWFESIK